MYSVVHFSYNSVQCKPNEHAVPYSADRGSGVDFLTVSGFLGESGTLVKTKELAVRSQIINILCLHHSEGPPGSRSSADAGAEGH